MKQDESIKQDYFEAFKNDADDWVWFNGFDFYYYLINNRNKENFIQLYPDVEWPGEGLYICDENEDLEDSLDPNPFCPNFPYINVLTLSCDKDGKNPAIQVEFKNLLDKYTTLYIPLTLSLPGEEFNLYKCLMKAGFIVPTEEKLLKYLKAYLFYDRYLDVGIYEQSEVIL